jgi:ubiquinol oxidase
MPYFSYITMLHLYESFGWWRAGACVLCVCCVSAGCGPISMPVHECRFAVQPQQPAPPALCLRLCAGAELRKVHFAEEWNELHHLQVLL